MTVVVCGGLGGLVSDEQSRKGLGELHLQIFMATIRRAMVDLQSNCHQQHTNTGRQPLRYQLYFNISAFLFQILHI